MDFRPFLIDYMVEKGLKFAQDVDWSLLRFYRHIRGRKRFSLEGKF